jgi:hypothetical protein
MPDLSNQSSTFRFYELISRSAPTSAVNGHVPIPSILRRKTAISLAASEFSTDIHDNMKKDIGDNHGNSYDNSIAAAASTKDVSGVTDLNENSNHVFSNQEITSKNENQVMKEESCQSRQVNFISPISMGIASALVDMAQVNHSNSTASILEKENPIKNELDSSAIPLKNLSSYHLAAEESCRINKENHINSLKTKEYLKYKSSILQKPRPSSKSTTKLLENSPKRNKLDHSSSSEEVFFKI